ncbi:MAG: flavodoxin family protein [Erysipelotrichaceae bacterium]|nr:flavodoxin family protein [Erysipelotrichaceae bacterium]
MKITVLYGSARKNGVSSTAARKVLERVYREGDEVREYPLAEQHILPCVGCLACRKQEVCSRRGDDMERIYADVVSSDFVIFASPIYCFDVTGPFKLMYDRLYPMLDGPQPKYTPRHPGIRSCLILSQGAPLTAFGDAAERNELRLKNNGFTNLATLRYGMGIDLSYESEEVQQRAAAARQKQEEDNDRLIEEIAAKLNR